MATRTIAADSNAAELMRAQRTQDLVLVSVFGLWTVLLGVSPLLAFRGAKRCSQRWYRLISGSACGEIRAKLRPGF